MMQVQLRSPKASYLPPLPFSGDKETEKNLDR